MMRSSGEKSGLVIKQMARHTAVTFTPASGRLVVTGARICFEPSAYDGSETAKRSLVLEVTDDINDTIKEWEMKWTQ